MFDNVYVRESHQHFFHERPNKCGGIGLELECKEASTLAENLSQERHAAAKRPAQPLSDPPTCGKLASAFLASARGIATRERSCFPGRASGRVAAHSNRLTWVSFKVDIGATFRLCRKLSALFISCA